MDRRESIKSLLIGSLGTGAIVAGCAPGQEVPTDEIQPIAGAYGRTEKEKKRDTELMGEQFFTDHELDTVATLCDLILPATEGYNSASEAGVPAFIDFIVKDMPRHQLPLRGGIAWLDNHTNEAFNLAFAACSADQQKSVLDKIAFNEEEPTDLAPGIEFFNLIRNLTMTGFYTSELGIKELGYKGNTPNVWDGVPDAVLQKHGMSYDPNIKYVDQSQREVMAEWDDEGNLIT
jgi:hypothetical protein